MLGTIYFFCTNRFFVCDAHLEIFTWLLDLSLVQLGKTNVDVWLEFFNHLVLREF